MVKKDIVHVQEHGKMPVEHVARLARIELTEEERERFTKDLAGILNFIKKLNEVEIDGITGAAGGSVEGTPKGLSEGTRKDEIFPQLGEPREILEQVPTRKGGWVEVRAIFKEPK